jgi:hypothetical protein
MPVAKYLYIASIIAGNKLQLNLRGKYLEPIIETFSGGGGTKLERAMSSKTDYYNECVENGDSGAKTRPGESTNNRSSVKVAHRTFIQQLKRAIGTRTEEGVRKLLREMDDDGNGAIDRQELLLGAHFLRSTTPNATSCIATLCVMYSHSLFLGIFQDCDHSSRNRFDMAIIWSF